MSYIAKTLLTRLPGQLLAARYAYRPCVLGRTVFQSSCPSFAVKALHTSAPPITQLKNNVNIRSDEGVVIQDDLMDDVDYLPRSNEEVESPVKFTSGEPVQSVKVISAGTEVDMKYQDVGVPHGHPVLVIHDMPGFSEDFKDLFKAFVNDGFRVIAPNLPGFGVSQSSHPVRGVSQLVQLLGDFLDEINVSEVHAVIGHGSGALLACQLAASTDKCHSLIAFNPTGFRSLSTAQWYNFLKESPFTAPLLGMNDPDGLDGKFQPEHMEPLLAAIENEASLQLEDVKQAAKTVKDKNLPVLTFITKNDTLTPVEDGVEFSQTCGVSADNVVYMEEGKNLADTTLMRAALVFPDGGHNALKTNADVVTSETLKVLRVVDAGVEREKYSMDHMSYDN